MSRYFDDELYHWKYKRKYRGPSGDWVYVYDDGSMSEKGTTTTSYSEKDAQGNASVYKKKIVTNPNRFFSQKSSSEKTETKTVTENGQTKTTTKHTVTETVERGRLHIMKMDLQRKITDLPKRFSQNRKASKDTEQYMKKKYGKRDDSKLSRKERAKRYKEESAYYEKRKKYYRDKEG